MAYCDGKDTLFPGKVRISDLLNPRYISRKPIYDFLVQQAEIAEGDMLDFGCGSMQYKTIFTNKGKIRSYEGLDVKSADEFGLHADNITYYDGVHIPFTNNIFDIVMAVEVFEHVENLDEVIDEIRRILKPNGKLIVTVPMTFPLHMKPYDFRRFTCFGLEKYLKEHGFTNIQIEPSTPMDSTLRRLKIYHWESKTPRLIEWRIFKLYVMYANMRFLISQKTKRDGGGGYAHRLVGLLLKRGLIFPKYSLFIIDDDFQHTWSF